MIRTTYKYVALIATESEGKSKLKFTKECLLGMCSGSQSFPVFMDFVGNPIGASRKLALTDDGILCEFECDIANLDRLDCWLVPRCMIKQNDLDNISEPGVTLIRKAFIESLGITSCPDDQSIGHIKMLIIKERSNEEEGDTL